MKPKKNENGKISSLLFIVLFSCMINFIVLFVINRNKKLLFGGALTTETTQQITGVADTINRRINELNNKIQILVDYKIAFDNLFRDGGTISNLTLKLDTLGLPAEQTLKDYVGTLIPENIVTEGNINEKLPTDVVRNTIIPENIVTEGNINEKLQNVIIPRVTLNNYFENYNQGKNEDQKIPTENQNLKKYIELEINKEIAKTFETLNAQLDRPDEGSVGESKTS